MKIELITLGGGFFWCLDSALRMLKGAISVTSGYAGGFTKEPTYEEVCSGDTGHAEVVQVTFDSERLQLNTLLELFFAIHDPTTLDRQGADVGTQYRSIILYRNEAQKQIAEQVIQQLNLSGTWPDPIVTELAPMETFYPAESYHQDYYNQNSSNRYCQLVIRPKLADFKRKYAAQVNTEM